MDALGIVQDPASKDWEVLLAAPELADEIESLRAAIDRVRELHVYVTGAGCEKRCDECAHRYPCLTVRALDMSTIESA